MSIITCALGAAATLHIGQAGALAARTYDQSLTSINYARAAAADFAAMRAALAERWLVTDANVRDGLDRQAEASRKAVLDDLAIAAQRAQSARAQQAAAGAVKAMEDWNVRHRQANESATSAKDWMPISAAAARVDQQIGALIDDTAKDAQSFRQRAQNTVAADLRSNLFGTCLAIFFAAAVAWFLDRRIVGPVAVASDVAMQIAHGKLDVGVPSASIDEFKTLLSAMDLMRRNLRERMAREVDEHRSAQSRLANALESSREGIVVVNASGNIALANEQFANFLGLPSSVMAPGTALAAVTHAVQDHARLEEALLGKGLDDSHMRDLQLSDGRWLRISRSPTQEGGFVAVLSDISLLKQQKQALKTTNLRLDAALANMSQGLCLFDSEGRLMVANRQYCEIFALDASLVRPGLPLASLLKHQIASGILTRTLDAESYAADLHADAQHKPGTFFEHLEDGRVIAVAHQPVEDGGWVATFEDVTERRTAEAQILFMAHHDTLTQLANRTTFGERIEQALERTGDEDGFAILCLDLDRFKQVNDTLGHPVGDCVLRVVAERLGGCVRPLDTVARLGGDEFAILMSDGTGLEDATALASRIIDIVNRPILVDGRLISVGVSIGVALAPEHGRSAPDLMKNADAALYQSKADGRSTWRAFEPQLDERLQARVALEIDLRRALADGQFEIHYQPIYDLKRDLICGFEALLRWDHPTRGWISPGEFIPIAESIGLILPLGEWVVRTACAEASRWPSELKLAVNVSSVQFRCDQLVAAIRGALESSGLSPDRLELEITESVLLEDDDAVLARLHSLRALGLRFSMDDFGTGYSSLSSLRRFPFAKIKIDQTFIRDLARKPESALIVRATTGLGSSLGMLTTAEGVETREQLARLRIEGCDEIQGHYISPAVPPHAIHAVLAEWNTASAAA